MTAVEAQTTGSRTSDPLPAEHDAASGPARRRPCDAVIVSVLLSLGFGMIFAFLTPTFWGADEAQHVSRVYSITRGDIDPSPIADSRGPNFGGLVPTSVYDMTNWSARTIGDHPPAPFAQIADRGELDRLDSERLNGPTREVGFANTSIYSPLAYVPAIIGMGLARAGDLSIGGAVLLMRLIGVAAYAALIGGAVHSMRRFRARWLVVATALIPMSVFQASTVTTDVMTLGLSVLAGALVLKTVFFRTRLSRPETAALFAAAIAIPLCKSGYLVFLPLVLVVPAGLLALGRFSRTAALGAVGVGTVLFAWWSEITVVTSSAMGFMRPQSQWGTVVPAGQIDFIVTHPLSFAHVLVNTAAFKGNMYFTQFFGDLGFTFVSIPASATVAVIIAFVLAFGLAERVTVGLWSTLAVGIAVVLGLASVFGALYLGFSPVGYWVIDGVQGRYFLPFVLLVLGILLRLVPLRWHLPELLSQRRCGIAVATFMAVALSLGAIKYYFVVWV